MATNNYGFSGLNSNLNSSQLGGKSHFSPANFARVISIILNESHPRFKELGEWAALGAIEYDIVSTPVKGGMDNPYPVAFPLYPNEKQYPLVGEIVELKSALSNAFDLYAEGSPINSNRTKKYYTKNINIWNNINNNVYSFFQDINPLENKSYSQIESGSSNVTLDSVPPSIFGKTFNERIVKTLLPYEGDIIYEGRWGNTIRLGSTVMNENNWSTDGVGIDGDPIIIIKNSNNFDQELAESENFTFSPIEEDINLDDSSIYLTSTQNIKINPSSDDYTSYKKDEAPTNPKSFSGKQIILNSGRLLFNSTSDHILLSSANSINLNSLKSVNIDTKKVVIQSDKIFLGNETLATEPLLLGNTTSDLLRDLISAVKSIADALENLTSDPTVPGAPATFATTLLIPMAKVNIALKGLEKKVGSSPQNCTLTSKRNFTL